MGYRVHGTIGVLIRAIRRHQRTKDEVISLLRQLPTQSTLYIRRALLQEIHIDTVRSLLPEARNLPSGLKATDQTQFLWPRCGKISTVRPIARRQWKPSATSKMSRMSAGLIRHTTCLPPRTEDTFLWLMTVG